MMRTRSTKSRREAIVDAAEKLFSRSGYDGVSMRMVAESAPVGLGLLTYHFPTKDTLFETVVARRAEILNEARRTALKELENPDLEKLLLAFFKPYVELVENGDAGWRAYARLHALLTQDPRWTELATRHFGAVASQVIELFCKIEPELSRDEAAQGYVFLIGMMVTMFADTGLLDRFTDGRLSSHRIGVILKPMVTFGAAGIRSLRNATAVN